MDPKSNEERPANRARPLQWWSAGVIVALGSGAVIWTWIDPTRSHQQRNLTLMAVLLTTIPLLLVWWGALSGAPERWRRGGVAACLAILALAGSMLRVTGVSGDLLPIFEFRWKSASAPIVTAASGTPLGRASASGSAFPQFLGPDRNGVIRETRLASDWSTNGPVELWRHPVGAAWSGFAVVDGIAYTQEQAENEELVAAYDLLTGKRLWEHRDAGRYSTTIAGEGPRSTPTVDGDQVYTLGATGTLNCLDRRSGRKIWGLSLTQIAGCSIPEWGFTSAPLIVEGRVIVLAGGKSALWAFNAADGKVAWSAGDHGANYGSVSLLELSGERQLVHFGSRTVVGLDPKEGHERWKHPFGTGMPLVANPVLVGTNRLVVSAGYGVGAELIEIGTNNTVRSLWTTKRLKAKFANPVRIGDMIVGLDDGILAAVDLTDGRQLWKEGRYGHGQGLLVGDLLLLMAESGDILLLQPTPDGPHELARRRVFDAKTWNPIALAGDLLLVRNDREAACLRMPLGRR
jgi:outer membrane protein assembly factor BamB